MHRSASSAMIGTSSTGKLFIFRYCVFVTLCHAVLGEAEGLADPSSGECLLQQQLVNGRAQPVQEHRHATKPAAEKLCKKGILLKKDGWAESVCCDSTCGSCGGPRCADAPGGAERCCGKKIKEIGTVCSSSEDVACVVQPLPDQVQSETFKVDDYVFIKDPEVEGVYDWVEGVVTSVDPLKVDGDLVNKVPDSDLILAPVTKAPNHYKLCNGKYALTAGSVLGNVHKTPDCWQECDKDPLCTHFTFFEGTGTGCRMFSDCSKTGVSGQSYSGEGPRTWAMTRAAVQAPDMTQLMAPTPKYRCDTKISPEDWGNLGKEISSVECRQACMSSASCTFVVYRLPQGTCTQVEECDNFKPVGDGPFTNWKKEAPSPTDAPPAPVVRPTAAPPTAPPVVRPTAAPPTDKPVTRPTAAPQRPTKPPRPTALRRRRGARPSPSNGKPRSTRRRRVGMPDVVRKLKVMSKKIGSLGNRVTSIEADAPAK